MRISIFPLPGVILFPGMQVPLHIFEPRYRSLVKGALARDRRIGLIQPRTISQSGGAEDGAALYTIGCLGKIADVEALDDGRFNLVLEGESRFRLVRELDATTPFRQIEADLIADEDYPALSPVERAGFEREARRFADAQGYAVDWEAVTRLDDTSLIDGTSQIVPFDIASKQALLEASSLTERCELLIQLMQFFARRDSDDPKVTLQ